MAEPAALGFVPHTGWAVLVAVAGDAPRVVHREKFVVTTTGEDRFAYHVVAEKPAEEARVLLEATEATIDALATVAMAALVAKLREQGLDPVAAAVVGKVPKLPPLERILAAHPMLHTAEGDLWRRVIAKACDEFGVPAFRIAEKDLAERLGAHERAEQWLADTGRTVGRPWSKDHQLAASAAWLALFDRP